MKIDLDQIRDLLDIVSKTDIVEFSIQIGEEKVTIRKSDTGSQSHEVTRHIPAGKANTARGELSFEPKAETKSSAAEAPAPTTHQGSSSAGAGSSTANGLVPVTSPMVGTFYRASSPSAQPYVDVGDRIAVGQTVCIIEAMKLMNDMPSEVSGVIVKVCVENGSTVEYGQQLFLVDPKA